VGIEVGIFGGWGPCGGSDGELRVGTSRLRASCCGGIFESGIGAPPPYKFQSVRRDNSRAARASRLIGVDPGFGGEFGPEVN